MRCRCGSDGRRPLRPSLYLHQHHAWDAPEILKLLDLWPSLSSPMAGLVVPGGQQGLVAADLWSSCDTGLRTTCLQRNIQTHVEFARAGTPEDEDAGELLEPCTLEDEFTCFLQCVWPQRGGGQQREDTEAGEEHCIFVAFSPMKTQLDSTNGSN